MCLPHPAVRLGKVDGLLGLGNACTISSPEAEWEAELGTPFTRGWGELGLPSNGVHAPLNEGYPLTERLHRLSDKERKTMAHFLHRQPVARNTNEVFAARATLGERIADQVAALGRSWPFIFSCLALMSLWMLFNVESAKAFDQYPFILLNLVLSCLAALQAPISLHLRLDELQRQQWSELMALQVRQLACLERLEARLTQVPHQDFGTQQR